jgi:hypothetical protein
MLGTAIALGFSTLTLSAPSKPIIRDTRAAAARGRMALNRGRRGVVLVARILLIIILVKYSSRTSYMLISLANRTSRTLMNLLLANGSFWEVH